MALDESKNTDKVFTVDGYDYVVDEEFLKEAQPIKVDFLDVGFKVTSSLVLDSGCGSCGSGSCG